MDRLRTSGRTPLYIAIAVGVVIVGLLTYGLAHAITQASLALVAGLMLLLANTPEMIRTARQHEFGLALLNTLVAVALLSFFMAHWMGILFYVPLIVSLVLAMPLTLNRVGVARAYVQTARGMLMQLRQLLRLRNSTPRP